MIRAVGKVLDQIPADAMVIPGHGPLSSVEGLRDYQRMLDATVSIVQERMNQGRTLEQITAAGLPEEWSDWGGGFISTDRWLETVYRSLSAESR